MILVFIILLSDVHAETVYVDGRSGGDQNPGTIEKPIRTIGRASEIARSCAEPGPTLIKIEPGIYNLGRSVTFDSTRSYTAKDRFVIEASILPDDPQWKPAMMPVILSTEPYRAGSRLR